MITWLVSFYCACILCCGPKAQGITKNGMRATRGVTAACDKSRLNQVIWIEGFGWRICEDIGSAIKGNRIDIFVDDHQHALQLGRQVIKGMVIG